MKLQSKLVDPSTNIQYISKDNDYDYLYSVVVNPVVLSDIEVDSSTITQSIYSDSQLSIPNNVGFRSVKVKGLKSSDITLDASVNTYTVEGPIKSVHLNGYELEDNRDIILGLNSNTVYPPGDKIGYKKVTVVGRKQYGDLKPENIKFGKSILGVRGIAVPCESTWFDVDYLITKSGFYPDYIEVNSITDKVEITFCLTKPIERYALRDSSLNMLSILWAWDHNNGTNEGRYCNGVEIESDNIVHWIYPLFEYGVELNQKYITGYKTTISTEEISDTSVNIQMKLGDSVFNGTHILKDKNYPDVSRSREHPNWKLYLFVWRPNGSFIDSDVSNMRSTVNGVKIYNIKVYRNGSLYRNYIPKVYFDASTLLQEAYFYDTSTGETFGRDKYDYGFDNVY